MNYRKLIFILILFISIFIGIYYLYKPSKSNYKDFEFDKEFKNDIRSIKTLEDLNLIEYKLGLLDAYNWLTFNFPDIFTINPQIIKNERAYLNELVMFFLKEDGQLYKQCQKCHTHIPLGQYNFCQPCYSGRNRKDVNKQNFLNKKNSKRKKFRKYNNKNKS